jgi:parvulin-like peptidyl-prolyl isomerase
MLDSLRKKQKMIIYIVAAAFILTGAGATVFGLRDVLTSRKNYLGKVNGQKITLAEFNAKVQEVAERYREQGQEVNDEMMKYAQRTAWDELVNDILWTQQVKKHRIKVSENEILTAIQNDPPQDLMQNPQLQTDGKFDKKKYLDALKNDIQFYAILENYMRSYLPRKKLQDKIKKEAGITMDSLKVEYNKEMNVVVGKALWFDFNKADSVYVSDAEVKAYYDKNKETEYKKGPASRIKYLVFDIKPSDADYNLVKTDIDMVYNQAIKGVNFAELAERFSEDPGSAKQGGSLGTFGKGQMVPEFEKTAFSMKAGDISKPFRTDFGWHIIRCDSTSYPAAVPQQVKASHVLLKVDTSSDTKNAIRRSADNARDQIKKTKDIDKVAKQLKMEVMTSEWTNHDAENIGGIGQLPPLQEFMRTKKEKSVSDVYTDQSGRLIVAFLMDNKKVYYEDFEQLKLQIKFKLEKEKKIADVKLKAADFLKRVKPENYFTQGPAEGWKVIELAGHKENGYIKDVNARSEEFDKAVLALKTGDYSGLINTKEGPFVVHVEERKTANMADFAKDKAKQDEIRNRLEEAAFNRWFQDLRKKAKIVDNRSYFGF